MSKKRKNKKKFWTGWKKDTRFFCTIGLSLIVLTMAVSGIKAIMSAKNDYDKTMIIDAKAVSIKKVDRKDSRQLLEAEREKGATNDELRYAWDVGYQYVIDDKTYDYHRTEKYYSGSDRRNPKMGDTYPLFIGIKDGEVIPDAETPGHALMTGIIIAVIASGIFFILAFVREHI